MRRLVVALLIFSPLLGGCVAISPEEQRAEDAATCRGYGFRPRTTAFAECLQRLDLSRDADRRALLYGSGLYGPGIGVGFGTGRIGPYY